MRRALITGTASLLAVALIPSAAQAATQVREVHYEWPVPTVGVPGTPSEGAITLDFIFKNTRSNKKRFTPRLLTRIAFDKLYLTCTDHMTYYNRLFLTATFETKIELRKIPISHPKPDRYAFRTVPYSFSNFNGTISVVLWKTHGAPKPRPVLSWGDLAISDLDADPGHANCSNDGLGTWGGIPVVPV
jgi:hypothetical protein